MLIKYKNQIFEKIKELGYDVNLFEFIENEERDISFESSPIPNKFKVHIVKIKDSQNYEFILLPNPTNSKEFKFRCKSPENNSSFIPSVKPFEIEKYYSITSIMNKHIKKWLDELKDYLISLKEPDLWELAKHQENIFSSNMDSFEPIDDYLTPQEQKQFYVIMNDFERKLIEQYQPTQEKIEEIHKIVQEIKTESLKQSKKTLWQKFNERWFPNIATTLGFEVAKAETVQNLFLQSFQSVSNIISYMIKISIEYPLIP